MASTVGGNNLSNNTQDDAMLSSIIYLGGAYGEIENLMEDYMDAEVKISKLKYALMHPNIKLSPEELAEISSDINTKKLFIWLIHILITLCAQWDHI